MATTGHAKEKDSKRQLVDAQKISDIARVRKYDIKELLTYDLVETNYLFDRRGLMNKLDKSDICHELEKLLLNDDYLQPKQWSDANTTCIVNVMGCMRRLRTASVKTFGEFCQNAIEMTKGICCQSNRIDFVFDTYIEDSVKDSERARRNSCRSILLLME